MNRWQMMFSYRFPKRFDSLGEGEMPSGVPAAKLHFPVPETR